MEPAPDPLLSDGPQRPMRLKRYAMVVDWALV